MYRFSVCCFIVELIPYFKTFLGMYSIFYYLLSIYLFFDVFERNGGVVLWFVILYVLLGDSRLQKGEANVK